MQKKNSLLTEDIKRYNRYFWTWVIGVVAFVALIIVATGFGLFGELPSFRDLENPKSNLASIIYAEDKAELGTYYVQNRSNVRFKDISPNVINALVATEDVRFLEHSGVDFKRTFSIILYNLIGKKQGASTITQQLALNLFSEQAREKSTLKRIPQKLKELIVAVRLERNYTKEEIITMYLNTVDFGNNSFGIKAAARTYFNTTPAKLDPAQAATLVGILKGTSLYSPTRNPERSLGRRNLILRKMADENFISEAEAEKFKQESLGLKFNPASHSEGLATYFRAVLKKDIQQTLKELSITKADGTPYDLDRDGLKIYTTINTKMQRYAEESQIEYMKTLQKEFNAHWKGRDPFKGNENLIKQGMKRSDRYKALIEEGLSESEIEKNFNTPTQMEIFSWRGNIDTVMKPIDSIKYYKMILRNSLMSMDPNTGEIKAWVGGINFEHFKYDQVKMGTRQVGSTAKPFTYAVGIDNGYSPCYQVNNVPYTVTGYGEPWTPRGHVAKQGYLTLRQAMALSQNYITAWVMQQVGPESVAALIQRMGITSNVPPYPSIALGSFEASVFDMTGAYSAFVNHGVWTEPTYLLRVEDKNGNVLFERKPKVVVALNPQTAYIMTYMLKGVVEQGTGVRLRYRYGLTNPIGGKTGTTNDNSDGWFMAITPQLVTGIWTGCEDRAIHFRSTNLGEGANTALPIFAGFIKKVYADPSLGITKGDFEQPTGGISTVLDCNQYHQGAGGENQEGSSENLNERLGF
ncbi:Peptidoglycan glycosyltransferase [Pseudopedobacter saltans DSM 12145]|uniref:Peptidoglycan glycosyltransferase n=1 Tax=Pseudopedobacter saltans (strain ATCC 51119 / DSM 12145 / JCM 21818 / CCUG 39354 / LMG 10337 / NBRC 100064 / NCIMB 13643) TaxID=762903 RepID=F0S4P4_PSESL|nr:transglycosylase domain-containing protein [Pseudopedobacter saltans]ADY53062.1 Peptidoglycan glycosyltransferase [Pseudopedobacter saltans DSM 12145]